MDLVRFRKIGRIPELSEDYSLIARSVANEGSLLFLFVERAAERAVAETFQLDIGTPYKNGRSKALLSHKGGSRLDRNNRATRTRCDVSPSRPDGRVLLVGARCSFRAEGDYDLNGIVIDPLSGRSTRMLLGDGIRGVQVDDLGRIWVSYFDEGIFGNFGWGDPGSAPVGLAGLVCFSDSGEKIWEYPYQTHDPISDCYALNVSGSQAAIFFYTDFPVCRISSDFKLSTGKQI